MGIQINGQTDIISATDGSLAIQGASGNVTGDLTGNVTGNVNSTGVSTFSGGVVVAAGTTSAPSISPTGDSNTGIFFPAPDTIAFAEGGVEALRVDSSGRVGVGTDIPSNKFELVGSDGTLVNIKRTGGTSVYQLMGNTDNNLGYIGYETKEFVFYPNNTKTVGITTNTGIKLYNGAGIDFSASSNAAGMTSELLSDYEEGTWTPTVIFGGNSTGITYNAQTGGYIKIGSQVTVWFYLSLSNKGSSTGDSKIASLPFTNSSVPGRSEGATFTPNYWGGFNSAIIPGGYVQANTTLIYMVNTNAATSTGAIANSVWSNTTSLYGCVTYSIV
jgi:hypothetical protein